MSYQDVLSKFRTLNVCRVKNWEEVRIKGKFIRLQDIDDPNVEVVVSKWYYSIDLHETTKIFIGLHQEDERSKNVLKRRPYMDLSLAILRRTSDGVDLVDLKDFVIDRQIELEVNLEPGSYIILPRTTGCGLKRPENSPEGQNVNLLSSNGRLSELLETTLEEVFRKFDMLLYKELTFCEFKGFCECLGRSTLTEREFQTEILPSYHSTERGLTLQGFKQFFLHQIQEVKAAS
jgi:calpain-15